MGYLKTWVVISIVITITIISGCAPIYVSKLDSNYTDTKINGASLTIAPVDSITIDYLGNVKDEFGEGDQKVLIRNHFNENLLNGLRNKSTFNDIVYDIYSEQPRFSGKSLDLGDAYKLHIRIPADSNQITFENSEPDFILFIQNLFIGTESDPSWALHNKHEDNLVSSLYPEENSLTANFYGNNSNVYYQMPMPMPKPSYTYMPYNTYSTTKYLRYKFNFYFWDNKKHQIVTYGRVLARSQAQGMIQIIRMGNWLEIDEDVISRLLECTPFRRR
jgi:hypothetical protein